MARFGGSHPRTEHEYSNEAQGGQRFVCYNFHNKEKPVHVAGGSWPGQQIDCNMPGTVHAEGCVAAMKTTTRKPFTRLEVWAVFWLRIWWSIILFRIRCLLLISRIKMLGYQPVGRLSDIRNHR